MGCGVDVVIPSSFFLSIYLSIFLSIYLSIYLSTIVLSIYLSIEFLLLRLPSSLFQFGCSVRGG